MAKRKSGYEEMLQDVIETLKHSPDEVQRVIESSEKVVSAANDMTKDELALISAYVRADLKAFADEYQESKSGPFYLTIADSIWQGLLEITDRTKVEWVELFDDLQHQGVYEAGEVIGLGTLVCETCGHKMTYIHPTVIIPCIQCGHHHFVRQSLEP
ncbi:zinc ribbon-containing protein [Vibrio sp. SM6]|uniref:Zinc ribbon-containing protein n=1 Tax=Vibrio agarilyticus TaxID=2726741 RepID=A0A7X8TSP9_9VIBR|nr:zinc ribbon-containing protein [Vibrio agarilyticus]NLS14180.1 zinc ribbon-containing protein [Vibrio agarilyticus]